MVATCRKCGYKAKTRQGAVNHAAACEKLPEKETILYLFERLGFSISSLSHYLSSSDKIITRYILGGGWSREKIKDARGKWLEQQERGGDRCPGCDLVSCLCGLKDLYKNDPCMVDVIEAKRRGKIF